MPYSPVVIETGWETGLDPALVEKVRQLKALAAQEGITVGITSGHRTREQQAQLYAEGRTAPGNIITYARPGTSRHETGRAVDIFALKDGKPDYTSPAWKRLGALGKSLGLEWGWEWKQFKDRPHFQLRQDPAETKAPAPAPLDQRPGQARTSAAAPSSLSTPFAQRVGDMARRLGADPQHLMQVMQFETAGTFDPAIRNRAGSGATGLIQFTPATARQLGTSTEALARMTPEEQLVYVEKYLQPFRGRLKTLDDTYMAVLYPQAVGQGPDYPLFHAGTKAYTQNAALDVEQRGQVTVGSAMRFVRRKLGDLVSPASAAAAEPVTLDELRQVLGRSAPAAPQPGAPAAPQPGAAAPAPGTPPAADTSAVTLEELRRVLGQAPTSPAAAPVAAPAAPAPDAKAGYEVDVVLNPQGAQAPAAPPAAPTAETQVGLLQQQEQGRLAAEREVGSPTRPAPTLADLGGAELWTIPQEYYTPKPAPDLLRPAGALAIPTMTTAIGSVFGVPGMLAGAYLGRRANVALGLEPEGLGGDVASVALPALPAIWGAVKGATGWLARGSRAGQAVSTADEATTAAQKAYQEEMALRQAKEAATTARATQRRELALARHERGEAARQAKQAQQEQISFQTAEEQTAQQRQAYQQQVEQYEQAVTGQQQAVQTARALPASFAPETPSRTLYNRFRDIAPDAQVPLTTLQETAAGLQQQVSRGFETVTPTRLQSVLDEVQRLPEVVDGLTVHRLMQDIGPLTRSPNSQIRGAAKQLYAGFQDALEKGASTLPETAEARQVLLAANRAARREFALEDVRRIIRRAGISRTPEGEVRFNAARTLDQLERLYEENALFRGGWQPEEWQQLTERVGALTQTPRIPATRPGAAPEPVQPKAVEPFEPRPFQEPPERIPTPGRPPPGPPEPAVPTLPPKTELAQAVRTIAASAGAVDWLLGGPGLGSTVAALPFAADLANNLLLRQDGQRLLRSLMRADGTIDRAKVLALAGGRAAVEQIRKESGTATPQEAQQAVGTLRQRYAP
jgi:hypothetical protein